MLNNLPKFTQLETDIIRMQTQFSLSVFMVLYESIFLEFFPLSLYGTLLILFSLGLCDQMCAIPAPSSCTQML